MRGFEVIDGFDAVLPTRKTAASAGYDLAAAVEIELPPAKVTLVPTGLKAYMPQDEYLGVHIRSGMAIKHGLSLINGEGIIDADYYNNTANEGHIMIAVYNHGATTISLQKGMRIAQGIFKRYLLSDDDAADGMRAGGFGSTGERG